MVRANPNPPPAALAPRTATKKAKEQHAASVTLPAEAVGDLAPHSWKILAEGPQVSSLKRSTLNKDGKAVTIVLNDEDRKGLPEHSGPTRRLIGSPVQALLLVVCRSRRTG